MAAVSLDPRHAVAALKAAAEPTRLRILMLLAAGELNVKDLTRVLGQSQPRISRHLKLLTEAGLIERSREGSWAYFQLTNDRGVGRLVQEILASVDATDPSMQRDRQRASALRAEREASAQAFFDRHAGEWDRIRALHVPEARVEAAMRELLGRGEIELLVDLGTGTGRMLELFADTYKRAIGVDANSAMLAYARARLGASALASSQVRHGDIYDVQLGDGAASVVVMHQVLHFLADPGAAVREATRLLGPGGRLLVVDFAPHDLESLREQFAHERLGFARSQIEQLMTEAGLSPSAYRELKPDDDEGRAVGGAGLTVSLWLAEKAGSEKSAAGEGRRTVREKAA